MKKVYTAAFKAQVALDLLKEEKTLAQISAEYGVHANVLRDWRTQALKGLPTIFDRRDDIAALKTTHTQQVDELYAEIGPRSRYQTSYRRGVYGLPILWVAAGPGAAGPGVWSHCTQHGAPLHAGDGPCGGLSGAEPEQTARGPSRISLSPAPCAGSASQSHLGGGHHLRAVAWELAVPGGHPGLVFTLCGQLGIG